MSPFDASKAPKVVGPGASVRPRLTLRARWQNPRFRWAAIGIAGVLLASTLGVALLFAPRGDGHRYLEVYVTDFPGDFEKFQLTVAGVYVGEAAYELQLDAKQFDILQYHGADNSLLIAYGDVPEGDAGRISVVFARAQAYFAGQWVPITIPHRMLTITDGLSLGGAKDGAFLLDLEMEKSLVLTEKGYTFEPYVKSLYQHDFSQDGPAAPDGPPRGSLAKNGFTDAPQADPGQVREDPPPPRDDNPRTTSSSPAAGPVCTDNCDEQANNASDEEPAADPITITKPHPTLPSAPDAPPFGGVNDANGCPEGDPEVSDGMDAAAWMNLQLARERCDLERQAAAYYDDSKDAGDKLSVTGSGAAEEVTEGLLTLIAYTAQNGLYYGGKVEPIKLNTNTNGYQGAPSVDVDDILSNLPDVTLIPDPQTGVALTADEIQSAAAEIVRLGGHPLFTYSMAPAIAFQATAHDAWVISQSDLIEWVELAGQGANVRFDSLATANVNTQVTPLRSYVSPSGAGYDGHGVGIAMIDSGVDGLHRDVPYDELGNRAPSAAILENCWINPPKNTYGLGAIPLIDQSSLCVSAPSTDSLGHGTMVAGVALGRLPADGAQTATLMSGANPPNVPSSTAATASNWLWGNANTASNLAQRGVAPQAKGYAISFTGDGASLLMATLAYDRLLWMLDHPKPGDPRILVVTNSWETSWYSTDENSLLYWQINEVINRGVTVVFTAGNGGGDGVTSMTSPECVHPREGVVCVGAVEDNDQSNRTRANVWFASSRGARFTPTTWPDVCAPGTRLRTTYPTMFSPATVGTIAAGNGVTSPYALFTGTSAAAPYVAGVIALMQQARADAGKAPLVPADVEFALEHSAYAFPNVSGGYALSNDSRFNGSNYECGHGLVDAQGAVEIALNAP